MHFNKIVSLGQKSYEIVKSYQVLLKSWKVNKSCVQNKKVLLNLLI